MRRDDREIVDEARVRTILRTGRFATFALVDEEQPYVVTLSYGYDEPDSRLYFHVAHEGRKLDIIRRNPRACGTVVIAGEYLQGECAHPYESVVMVGEMRVVSDAHEKSHALRTLIEHLEDDADGYWEKRSLDDIGRMEGFTALCFEIKSLAAKAGS